MDRGARNRLIANVGAGWFLCMALESAFLGVGPVGYSGLALLPAIWLWAVVSEWREARASGDASEMREWRRGALAGGAWWALLVAFAWVLALLFG